MKKVSKKLLSVLLSFIMVVSTVSVCFGSIVVSTAPTASAADDTNAVKAFVAAMKCDAMKSFSTVYAESTKNSGASKEVTNTFTYTAPSYAHYEQVVNVVTKLDAAIKGLDEYKNGNTHNNGGNCQDGWGKGTATDKCTDLGWIERHLKLAIGDAELATLNNTYNFANLCNAIFNMDDCEWRNADNDLDGDDTTSTSNVEARVHNVLVVTISDVSGKILSYNSVNDIPDTLGNKFEYKLSMCRQNFQTGRIFKTNHYHHALNTKNSDASNPAPSQTGTTSTTAIKANINTCLTALSAYSKYFEADEISDFLTSSTTTESLGVDRKAIADAKKALTDTSNGTALYNKFVKPSYDVDTALNLIDNAVSFLSAAAVVEKFEEYLAVDYSSYTTAQLYTLKTDLEATYDTFKALEEATQQMIIDEYNLDTAAIEAKITEIDHAWQVSKVTDFKVTVDKHIADYENWEIEDVDEGRVTTAQLTTALALLNSDLAELGNYTYEYVTEACGRQYVTALEALRNKIQFLAKASGYNDSFLAEFEYFDNYIEEITTADYEELRSSLEQYDTRYSQLKTLISKMETELGKDNAQLLFDTYDQRMTEHINNAYAALNARTEVQINIAYDLYTDYEAAYGKTVHMASLESYKILRESIGLIDTASYEYLLRTVHFGVSAETVAKYDALQAILPEYTKFEESKGFATYQPSTIGDIVREETADDIAREGDYTVTDAKVEKVIELLDAVLTNKDVQALLGSLINEDGEAFSIAGLVRGLIEDGIYSDSLINTIIQFIYPAVANIFTEVWMGIDPKIKDDNMEVMPNMFAKVDVDLHLYTVETATAGLDMPLFPISLAAMLKSEYSQFSAVAAVLEKATTPATIAKDTNGNWDESTRTTPWNDAVLYTEKLDAEGNVVTDGEGNPTMVLNLDWGIDELTGAAKRERFLQAAQAALTGLEPILLALLSNKAMNQVNSKIGTGDGDLSGLVVDGIPLIGSVTLNGNTLDVHTIDLILNATANDGYNNVIAPLLEMLGLVAPNGRSFNSTRDVLEKGIIEPLEALIAKLDVNPVATILDIIPNLVYAIEADLLLPKLDYLSTVITYTAGATINVDLTTAQGVGGILKYLDGIIEDKTGLDCNKGIIQNVRLDGVYDNTDEPLDVAIATFLDIGALLGGADLSSFAGIWEMITGLLGLDEAPAAPNASVLATLGTLTQIDTVRSIKGYNWAADGKAAHIVANRADVLVYLVQYVLESGILNAFIKNPTELVAEIFTGLGENPDDAIAAIVELLNQVEYDTLENYVWFNGYIDNQQVGTLTGTPAYEIYMDPANDWTREKAEYLYNNLDAIVASVLTLAGVDFDLNGLTADLFTNETLTSIAKLLGMLDLDALLAGEEAEEEETNPDANEPETVEEGEEAATPINDIVKALLGIDLSGYAAYANLAEDAVIDFGVTDADSFAAALIELLAPLKPVLDFILAGENLEVNFSADDKLTLIGYNGYDNAVAPLLEALGCDVEALTADNDALTLVVNALVDKIAEINEKGLISFVIDILPGVLYFLAGNNLATAVRNLLQPVYVILDTIRPIYDLDLNELVAGIEIGEEGAKTALGLDLDQLDLNAILALAEAFLLIDLGTLLEDIKQLIYDVCKVVGTEYDSVSNLAGQTTWKRGAYSSDFDQADMITVILSFVLEWATIEDNAAKLDELLGTNGLIAKIGTVFADIEIEYGTPNWLYWFDSEEAFNDYIASGELLPNSLAALTYPNDWTDAKAQYIADNLASLVDTVIGLIEINGVKYTSVAELLNSLVYGDLNITVKEADEEAGEEAVVINYLFSDETINALIGMLKGILANVDDTLLGAGYILDVDLVGLKNYTCTKDITTIADFFAELAFVLDTYAPTLVNLLFFDDDIRLAKKSDATDTIVINGGLGYEKGLALILEALGCDVPSVEEATTATVLASLAARVEEILAAPVNEVIDILPNLIYFLNADGASVAVDNLLKPVYAIIDKINGLGLLENPIDLAALLGFDLKYLSLEDILALVEEKTGLDFEAAEKILVDLCIGEIKKADFTYRMTADRKDTVTVILTTALLLVSDEDFAAKLDEMLGTDVISVVKTVFESTPVEYGTPDWGYAIADNETLEVIEYAVTYPNNWTEESAQYVAALLESEEFDKLVAGLIDSNYTSLSALLKDKVNVFTTETLDSLVALIAGLLANVDDELLKYGVLLNVDLVGLKAYKAPADIDTVSEFASELANILNTYAKGIVEWLLLGDDITLFVEDADGAEAGLEGTDIITINGAHGYAEGLALILEALGCENLPTVYDGAYTTEEIVEGVLNSLAARIEEIFNSPIPEALDLLPNLLYFLNAKGVSVAVNNLAGAFNALALKLKAFGLDITLNDLVDLKAILGVETEISLDNLTVETLLALAGELTGLDLAKFEDVLVGFALGEIKVYESVSSLEYTAKMEYKDDFDKHDLITVAATLAIITLTDDANAEIVKGFIGEEIYQLVLNLCNMGEVPVQEFDWQLTDRVGETFSALASSELYERGKYGPLYTEEMAQYIADNFGEFVDNIIYLLGISVEGQNVNTLKELINGLLGGSLYNSDNVIAIRDALAGVLANVSELKVNDAVVGGYIADILKLADVADINAVAKVEVPEFTNDRAQFVASLCDVLEPLYGVLKYVLADKDISFFVNAEKTDAIALKGAEGYAYGIIPLLEALECDNILAPADYYAAVEADGSVLLTSILNPLLDRVDEILADDPAQEILDMLPNLIYFINSNGVDTVVKNTLNAVYALLAAIEPVAKIDIYGLIGVDLAEINFEWLFDKALELIKNATGYGFEALDASAIAELTVGKLEEYTSLNGKTAYRMVYSEEGLTSGSKSEMVTIVMRLLITFIMHENNQEMLVGLLKDAFNMTPDAEKYVRGLIGLYATVAVDTRLGMDNALATTYYMFYGADIGVENVTGGYKDLNAEWIEILKKLGYEGSDDMSESAKLIAGILGLDIFEDLVSTEGIAPNGLIAFFTKLVDIFNKFIDWIKGLFA